MQVGELQSSVTSLELTIATSVPGGLAAVNLAPTVFATHTVSQVSSVRAVGSEQRVAGPEQRVVGSEQRVAGSEQVESRFTAFSISETRPANPRRSQPTPNPRRAAHPYFGHLIAIT